MYRNKKPKGFILGMAVVILAVAITISISISTVVLRDLKISSVSSESQLAYQLADSLMTCFSAAELEFGFQDASGRYRFFPTVPTSLQSSWFSNIQEYDPASIKCFNARIFSDEMITTNSTDPHSEFNSNFTISGVDYVASTTIDNATFINYTGGAMTKFFIKRSDFPRNSCAEIEVQTAPDNSRTFISKGKVPCYGDVRTERSITKVIQ